MTPALLALMPAGASMLVGLHRTASAEELRKVLDAQRAQLAQHVPACGIDTFIATEDAMVAVDVEKRILTLAVRGRGLKAIAVPCLGALGQRVRWVDDDTAVAGTLPVEGSLAEVATIRALLGRLDGKSSLYAIGDERAMRAMAEALPAGMPTPERAWGELGAGGKLEVRATFELGSEADARSFAEKLRPSFSGLPVQGGTLESQGTRVVAVWPLGALVPGVKLEDSPAAVYAASIGILAAVAVPAFMKNARKAKTVEAKVNVKRLYDGARTLAEARRKLPPSTEITPPLGACCKSETSKCAADPGLWRSRTWSALQFSLDEGHYYSYRYTAKGSTFTVSAFGDLNCDGVYSTFEMRGRVAKDGTVTGGEGLRIDRELD